MTTLGQRIRGLFACIALLGLVVAQGIFLCTSGIGRYAIATPDVGKH